MNNSIAFRPDNPLVADLKVRQALTLATNRQEIVDTLFSANYPVATSVISQHAAGYVDESSKLVFDQDKAKALFAEAGWTPGADGILEKDGKKLDLTVYVSLAAAAERRRGAAAGGPAMGAGRGEAQCARRRRRQPHPRPARSA